jgi:16S rRNA (uracil1498-N3)-methyltransferase
VGDEIKVSGGDGNLYRCILEEANPKSAMLSILAIEGGFGKHPYYLHIAVAPTKNIDRYEWFLEKATEVGIDAITPILCAHSERKVVKEERQERVVIAAAKQSLKAYMPKLNDMCSFEEFVENTSCEQRFIAHCYKDEKRLLQQELRLATDVVVLIGPEGDFSEEEVKKAMALGYVPVSLGESRLRTETAGVVACHTVALMNQV